MKVKLSLIAPFEYHLGRYLRLYEHLDDEEYVDHFVRRLRWGFDSVDVEGELLYCDPVTGIADFAEAEGFDGIYVGHCGRTGRAELLLGSVAKAIIERATVPVTVVR